MFFVGIIFTVAIAFLVFWIIKQGISVRWWEWLMGAMGVVLLVFTIQNFMGLMGENESLPAWMFWLYIGLPGLIFVAIPAILVFIRAKKA